MTRCRDRYDRHPTHVGSEPVAPSAYSLCGSCRWALAGSSTLGELSLSVLSTGQSFKTCLPCKFIAGLKRLYRRKKFGHVGPAAVFSERKQFAKLVGRLRRQHWVVHQACLRRPSAGTAVSWPLHAPRRHLESSLVGLRWRACHLPLAGLCAWQPVTRDDARCGRVPPPLLPAHPPQRLRPHPAFSDSWLTVFEQSGFHFAVNSSVLFLLNRFHLRRQTPLPRGTVRVVAR